MSIDIRQIFPGYQQLNPSGSASTLVFGTPRVGGFLAGDAFTVSDGTNSETFSYTQTPAASNEFSDMDGLVAAIEAFFTGVTTSIDPNDGGLTVTFPISGQPANPSATQANSGLNSEYELVDHAGTPTVVIPDNNTVEFSVNGNPISYKYQQTPASVRASANGHGGLVYEAAQDGLAGNGVNISLVEQAATTPGTKAVSIAESDSTALGGPVDTVTLTVDTNAGTTSTPAVTGNPDFIEANDLKIETAGLGNGPQPAGDEYQVVINYATASGNGNSASEAASGNRQVLTIDLDTIAEGTATAFQIANLINNAGLTHFTATGKAPVQASLINNGLTFTAVTAGAGGNGITITITENTAAGSDAVAVNGSDIDIQLDQAANTYFTDAIANLVNGDAAASALVAVTGGSATTAGASLTQTNLTGGVASTTLAAANWGNGVVQDLTGGVADVAGTPGTAALAVSDYTLQDVIDAVTTEITAGNVTLIQAPTAVTASDPLDITTPNLVTAGGAAAGWSNAQELAVQIVAANSAVLQIKPGTTSTLSSINPAAVTFAFTYQGVTVDNTYPVFANSIIAGYGGGDFWGSIVGTQGTADTGASNTFQYNEKYIAIPLSDLLLGSGSTNPNHLTAEESNQITGDYRKIAYHVVRKIHEYIDGLEHITGLTIAAGGTGYAVTDTVDIPGIGTGTIAIDGSGAITDIFLNGSSILSVNNPGTLGKGFTAAPVVTVNSSTGIGAGISADISDLDPGKMDITKGTLSENTATNELTRPYTISFTFNEQGLELSNED